ncbi:MAG: diaminopimelate epimerase [Terrimicrobiaceae bacterium]
MELDFWKMNGAGNDFVLLDNRQGSLVLSGASIARLCDRNRGVGADGVLLVEPAVAGADFRMRYFNADGGEAEMCGNGARCFARFAQRLLNNGTDSLSFETPAGEIQARLEGENVRLQMSNPHSWQDPRALDLAGNIRQTHFVNTGVPHAVVFVEDLNHVDVQAEGAAARYHEVFAPKGTNVNFVSVESPGHLAIRTYERGVEGETLACGTGVVASALIHAKSHAVGSPVSVQVRGGDILTVTFLIKDSNYQDVTLTGPADFVFQGRIVI